MSGQHAHALYVHGHSPLHRLAPQVKVVAAFGVVLAVVTTPREAIWAFAAYAVGITALLAAARIPARFAAARMVVEVPFVFLALLFPLVGGGEQVDVFGVSLSVQGLWDMWNLLAKATLGLMTAIVLAATTEVADLLRGFDALRVPRIVTAIIGFMVRYIDVVVNDFARMRIALASRGHAARSISGWRPYAHAMGAMFIRTYERGERVYLAMESRGYAGVMPGTERAAAGPGDWVAAALLVAAFWAVAVVARTTL